MTPVLALTEWDSAEAPVRQLSDADRRLADALAAADGGRLIVEERRDSVWVSSNSWIGVVRFEAFEVRVPPKAAGGNLGVIQMLDYTTGIGALRRHDATRELDAHGGDLIELIAWLFADATERIVRDGLLSDYVSREDTLHLVRGRVRLVEQVRRQYARVDPLEVAFDELEPDIPENQVILAALAATRGVVRTQFVQRPVRRLFTVFSEVCESPADPVEVASHMTWSRRNEHYRTAHSLAELLLRRLAVRDMYTPGGTRSFAFLINMNELFEAFVTKLTAEALSPFGIHVQPQARDRSVISDAATGKPYAAIIPDMLLSGSMEGSTVLLPVDAKYKLYDTKRLAEADVYQTFFYAFAYAPAQTRRQLARAVILYPRSHSGSDRSLRVDQRFGNQSALIHAIGIDLDETLLAVRRRDVAPTSIPALGRVLRTFYDAAREAGEEREWVA